MPCKAARVEAANDRDEKAAKAAEEREAAAAQKEYDRLISKADKSFGRQNYAEAKTLYLEAANLLPQEQYPVDRAAESEARIVDITQVDAEADPGEENGASSALDREYEDKVREADTAFDAEDWPTAKAAYEASKDMTLKEMAVAGEGERRV